MAKLRELLKFGTLKNLQLITGENSLDVNVSTVTVMEVPDIIQWLRGDDFLITSLYSIGDNEEKQCQLIYDLLDTQSACLAIKTGKYAHHISDKMIEIAKENHFPLLHISYETTYIDIIMDVMNVLMTESNRREMIGKYISNVIFHSSPCDERLLEEGRLLKIDLENGFFQSLLLETNSPDCKNENLIRSVKFAVDRLSDFIENLSADIFCGDFESEKGIRLLIYSKSLKILDEKLPFILQEIQVVLDNLPIPCNWKSGVGTAQIGAEGARTSYQESSHAIELGKNMEPENKIYRFENFELYNTLRTMLHNRSESLFADIFNKIRNPELMDTLTIYFECDGNLDETAKQLFTHKNTIKYRLNKIKELTGLDVKRQEDNFKLYFMILETKLCNN